jgi:hypothetical protein
MRRLIHIDAADAARAEETAPGTLHFISHATRLHGERELPGYRIVTPPTIVNTVVEVVEGGGAGGGNAPGYRHAGNEESKVQFHSHFNRHRFVVFSDLSFSWLVRKVADVYLKLVSLSCGFQPQSPAVILA